jgi:membrane protein implicated in regulation of membrane protease activity
MCGEDIELASHDLLKANIFSILFGIICFVSVVLYSIEFGKSWWIVILAIFIHVASGCFYYKFFARFSSKNADKHIVHKD